MILVTGATGTVGRHVLRLLSDRGVPARAMTRDPVRVPRSPAVEPVRADFTDPASLRAAVAGVEAVFLVTVPPVPTAEHDLALLDAARTAGVGRIVKLSAIGTGERIGPDEVGTWHRVAEDALRASGITWTVLRPSSFASNVLRTATPAPDLTGPARQGVIDPRDVAAVAVEALTGPGHAGRTYPLTGPELLTFRDQLDIVERVLGRPVPSVEEPPDATRKRMLGFGMPTAAVDAMLTGIAWAWAGHNAVLTDDVRRVLGRPPGTVEAWTRDHRDAF
jgi:uncharacterized protein YbjT (DUF2867 family)